MQNLFPFFHTHDTSSILPWCEGPLFWSADAGKGEFDHYESCIFALAYTIVNWMTEKQMSLIRTLRFTVEVIN